VSGSTDNTVKVWDASTGQCLAHCWDTVTEFDSGYQPGWSYPASSSDDLREAMGLEHGSMPSDLAWTPG